MSFMIESQIPLPPLHNNSVGKYPFDDMKVDDSFLVPCEGSPADRAAVLNRIRQAARAWRRRRGNNAHRFNCRSLSHGVRCWRVA